MSINAAKQFLGLGTGFIDVSRQERLEVRVTPRYLNEETNSRGDSSRRREGRVLKEVEDFLEKYIYNHYLLLSVVAFFVFRNHLVSSSIYTYTQIDLLVCIYNVISISKSGYIP